MIIFPHEEALVEQINANCSIRSNHQIIKTPPAIASALHMGDKIDAHEAMASLEDYDLYGLQSILVTSGWNKNRDIWLREELWAARNTPSDKPFNLEHNPYRVIGHITGNHVVDADMNLVGDFNETAPSLIHIVANAVIYRNRGNRYPELAEESAKLIEEIENDEWSVSVEALLKSFDYGVLYSNGEQEIIARDAKSSFLTKKLTIYGGDGEYNGGQLGRVLRDFTISGKGLVKVPANPDSCILSGMVNDFASAKVITVPEPIIREEVTMSENAEKALAEKDRRIEELQDSLAKVQEEANRKALAEKEEALAGYLEEVEALKKALADAKAGFETATKQLEETKTEAETVASKLEETEKQLDAYKTEAEARTKEAVLASRVSDLVDVGVGKEEASAVASKYEAIDEEGWKGIVEMQKQLHATASESEEQAEAEEEDPNADPDGKDAASASDISEAEEEADASLNADTDGADDQLQETIASLGELLTKKPAKE